MSYTVPALSPSPPARTNLPPARSAEETRSRILEAARIRFSQQGYDQVGVREIAAEAGVNASLVNRYFGTKKKLFSLVAAGAFDTGEILRGDSSGWGASLAAALTNAPNRIEGFDALQLLLRSSLSVEAGPIVIAHFRDSFILPLSKKIPSEEARIRAAMIASYLIGFATMRFSMRLPELVTPYNEVAAGILASALQSCIDGLPSV